MYTINRGFDSYANNIEKKALKRKNTNRLQKACHFLCFLTKYFI